MDKAEMEVLRDEIEDAPLIDPRDTKNTKPLEEVALISIHPNYSDCHVIIKTELTEELLNTLVEVLKKDYNMFVWPQGNVSGIDPQIAVHKLFTYPDHPPFAKKKKFAPECLKVIEEEVAKLIKANVTRESHYPNWLVNIVVAPKKGESGEYVLILLT